MTSRRLTARASLALVVANLRYWRSIAPLVRTQLARWERAADAIGDPKVRALALAKLRDERFNPQVATTLATLAPRRYRASVVEAIVALQVLYDYVDVLAEQSAGTGPAIDDRILLTALTDAVALPIEDDHALGTDQAPDYYAPSAYSDGGYLQSLVEAVRTALAGLPNAITIAPVTRGAAERCAQAQILHHGASRSGISELREWATAQAAGTGLGWQEFLAGASASVLAIHALIAASADPRTTREDAANLDGLYVSIGALTMLDSLVDRHEDIASGQLSYLQLYDSPEAMASGLANAARDGSARTRGLPNRAHHLMTLVGVVGYYASVPAANDAFGRPVIARVKRELQPLITPTLALMRGWRLAKRVRHA